MTRIIGGYRYIGGQWTLFYGRGASVIGGGRDTLVAGTYEPTTATAGVISDESALAAYNPATDNTVTIPDGAVITDRIIYGDVTFAGAAELHNCLLVGGATTMSSGNIGVLSCNNTRTGVAKLYDCTIRPRQQTDGRDCVLGRQYELYRCHLSGGVDGAGVYSNTSAHPGADVVIAACLIEDLTYVYPDQSHTDGTHNDCIQIQGGKNIHIIGNSLHGTSHALAGTGTNPSKPWLIGEGYNNGACIIIQDNLSGGTGWAALDSTCVIEKNWMRGSLAQLNVKTTATAFSYHGNHHYRETATNTSPAWSGYWIRFDNIATSSNIDGLTTGVNDNTWIDGPYAGAVLTTPRDLGIQSDA